MMDGFQDLSMKTSIIRVAERLRGGGGETRGKASRGQEMFCKTSGF